MIAGMSGERLPLGGQAPAHWLPRLSCDLLMRVCSQAFSLCLCCWSVSGAQVRRAVCYGASSSS
jgi:hypothetical protein